MKNKKSINQFKSPQIAQNFSKAWLKNPYRSGPVEYPSVSLTESRAAGSTSVWRHSVGATVEHHLEKQHSKDASIIEHGWETFKKLKKYEIFKRSKNTEKRKKQNGDRNTFSFAFKLLATGLVLRRKKQSTKLMKIITWK